MTKIKSIYYHSPSPLQLERTLSWLQAKGYRFISCRTLLECLSGECPMGRKWVVLTLDDAWRSNLQLLPVLERHDVPVTIFAPWEPVLTGNYWWEYVPRSEREAFKALDYESFCEQLDRRKVELHLARSCMTADELRLLDRHPLVSIQSHTLTHPILTSLTDDRLKLELTASKVNLENLLGHEVSFFSYPNGSYTRREVEAARAIYRMAFTTDLHDITPHSDLCALPRIEVTGLYRRDKLKFYHIWPVLRKLCLLN